MKDLEERVVVVTGAGSRRGIGRAIAECLTTRGARVAVMDIDLAGAEAVAQQMGSGSRRALPLQCDVHDEKSVSIAFESVLDTFGRVDILVNNAGITQPIKTIDMSLSDWQKVIDVNLTGTFLCSKAALPTMVEQEFGRIISISSVSAKRGGGVYGGSHYSASKAGILGFSKTLAREVAAYGITVNCVAPGLVDTDIMVGVTQAEKQTMWEAIPLRRPASTKEIAETVAFLASDAAAYITGEDIDVNGGLHID